MSANWLTDWDRLLEAGVDAVLEVLTSREPLSVELRQNSPFAGVLPEQEQARPGCVGPTSNTSYVPPP